jgi:hypothetical protein
MVMRSRHRKRRESFLAGVKQGTANTRTIFPRPPRRKPLSIRGEGAPR